jgi:hypothetical protein
MYSVNLQRIEELPNVFHEQREAVSGGRRVGSTVPPPGKRKDMEVSREVRRDVVERMSRSQQSREEEQRVAVPTSSE